MDLGVKEALLASGPVTFFTTSHFEGFPAVLVLLEKISVAELGELIAEAWLARAPKRLAARWARENLPPAGAMLRGLAQGTSATPLESSPATSTNSPVEPARRACMWGRYSSLA